MPQRKARDRRQGRATPDLGVVVVASGAVEVPRAPCAAGGGRLLAETAKAWELFWRSELAALVTDADRSALIRLFRLYDQRARFGRLVAAEPMVSGSKGQPRLSPAAAELASLDGRIVQLEDRFGLSPLARFRLGVMFGAAARSIESLNHEFAVDGEDDEDDPRVRAIDVDEIGDAGA